MADLLSLGTTALNSLQQAIATTGHNIANVNTPGYSRQSVHFDTLPAQFLGGHFIGNGVNIGAVERAYDSFLTSEVRSRTSAQAGFETLSDLSSRLDNLLADPAVGLGPVLDSFFGAVQDVANNPGSLPERQVLLGAAESLADRFNYLDSRFRSLEGELNARIDTSVADINNLAASIADLNGQITRATAGAGGKPPNDLLDARDQVIEQLSQQVGVSTVQQSDGAINVFVGSGQPLVVGLRAEQLQAVPDPEDSTQLLIGRATPSGQVDDISRFVKGGELGAVLEFRESTLNTARNELGLLATGITDTFNAQHRLGIGLGGQSTGDFFRPLEATFSPQAGNSGASSIAVDIDNVSSLTGDDYSIRFESGAWTLTNLSTKTSQTGAGPFTVDGLVVNVSGAPTDGDTFIIEPTRQSASLFSVVLTQPEDIAAASPLRSSETLSNTGAGELDSLVVADVSGLPLGGPVTLTFNPDALGVGVPGYDVTGIAGGPLAYDPATENNGKTFTLGGFDLTLTGQPDAGDSLVIENNTNGAGDNRNALALADLQIEKTLLGGTASYQDTYNGLVADIAVQTRRAQTGVTTETVLLNQAVSARDSVSGVNLDEEAANLIRFQQAYQAAAQMISVADELFQTLINATRR